MQDVFYIVASVMLMSSFPTLLSIGTSLSSIAHNLYVIANFLIGDDDQDD